MKLQNILYSKIELLQPFDSLTENKKNFRLKTVLSKQSFSSDITHFLTEVK